MAAIERAYEEVCKAHNGIADFRAKLLGLLPLASGAGISFVTGQGDLQEPQALGVFGALVSFGLYLYELRGIHRCRALRKSGEKLEERLLGDSSKLGAFHSEPDSVFKFVGNTWAALIIYPTVITGWAYLLLPNEYCSLARVWLGFLLFGWIVDTVGNPTSKIHCAFAKLRAYLFPPGK